MLVKLGFYFLNSITSVDLIFALIEKRMTFGNGHICCLQLLHRLQCFVSFSTLIIHPQVSREKPTSAFEELSFKALFETTNVSVQQKKVFSSAKINFLLRFSRNCLKDARQVRPLHCTSALLPFITFYFLPDIYYRFSIFFRELSF